MAATNITNSLTGFTGDSTQPATLSALAAAGFNVADLTDPIPKVKFDSGGAKFGDGVGMTADEGNAGRNYLRTNDTDYANVSFVAEVTIVTPDIDMQDAYFGLGTGAPNVDFFRTPDFGTPAASLMYWGENEVAEPTVEIVLNNDGIGGDDSETPAPGLGNGTHRVRLSYDWFQKKATFSFDLNYGGGEFHADVTAPAASTFSLYSTGTGFPQEPGRIYLGGDQGAAFKDFQVTVNSTPVVFGDLNNNGSITASDWAILRTNQYTEVTGSFQDAYFQGDLTADLKINHDDFVVFKTLYEAANGAGSFARMLASVPEPASLVLLLLASSPALASRRPAHRRV
jgi:hypothetical protein